MGDTSDAVPLGDDFRGVNPQMPALRVKNPHLGRTKGEIILYFQLDLLSGISLGDDLHSQERRTLKVLVNRLVGVGDAHVRLEPMPGAELVADLNVDAAP